MKPKTKLALSLVALALLFFAGLAASVAFAQTSPQFDAVWSRIASGGGERQSANYLAQDILGQWISQSPTGANTQVATDFFFASDAQTQIYLPIVVRR